jgi:hypothetical protein
VERTIAWIGRYRRLSEDDEDLLESSETMSYLAMSRLMLRRLARQAPYGVPSPQFWIFNIVLSCSLWSAMQIRYWR